MNIAIFIIYLFLFPFVIFPQQKFEIELVESIPIETTLDNPDIRNTEEVWLEMINSAQKTLDIEQFYITSEEGEPLDTILNAIVAAAKRGVQVRIIVDGTFYDMYPRDVCWLEAQSYNIEKRVIDFKSLTGGIQHAKFFIVDGEQVFLGSQNFDWRALKHIHELGIRIKHAQCIELYKSVFESDWNPFAFYDENLSIVPPENNFCKNVNNINYGIINLYESFSPGNVIILLPENHGIINTKGIEKVSDLENIKFIINNSKSEINLQFLSYNVKYKGEYWSEVDSALILAADRGVKVKLIISDWNLGKSAVEHFQYLLTYQNIEIKYTEIPEWSGGYIPFARVKHSKFITADSVCWIGTSNISKDYFYNSRNVGVVVENGKFTQRVRGIFYKSWNSEYAHYIEEGGSYKVREHGELK